jgi:hypothetical protein
MIAILIHWHLFSYFSKNEHLKIPINTMKAMLQWNTFFYKMKATQHNYVQ